MTAEKQILVAAGRPTMTWDSREVHAWGPAAKVQYLAELNWDHD